MRTQVGRRRAFLDGEVVVFDDRGRPDFAAERRRLTGKPAAGADRRPTFVA